MALAFYRRVPLDSEKMIIFHLSDKRTTKTKQKAQNFEFRKMADRYKSRDLNESSMNLLDATGLESQMQDVTKQSNPDDSQADGHEDDFKKIQEGQEGIQEVDEQEGSEEELTGGNGQSKKKD